MRGGTGGGHQGGAPRQQISATGGIRGVRRSSSSSREVWQLLHTRFACSVVDISMVVMHTEQC
jgi:hypothetical protein